jgi:DNA-binding NarL/FixJ family response regulator
MWYKKYNWNENPFIIKFSTAIVGREENKKLLLDYVNSGDISIITGDSGVGKTSLLKWLQKTLKKYKVYYVNAEGLSEFFSLQRYVKKPFFRKAILLVDEAQYCDENFKKELKLLYDDNVVKSVVIAQTEDSLHDYVESFKNRVGKRTIRLKGMDNQRAMDLINLRTRGRHPFDEKSIKMMVEEAKNNPRKILENCELACIELQYKEVTSENIKKALEKKRKEDLLNITKLEEPKLPKNLMPVDTKKLKGFSPMQKRILMLLTEGNRTTKQLATILNSSEGSVGKQLSNLTEQRAVKITNHRRPKVYGLTDDFKTDLQ